MMDYKQFNELFENLRKIRTWKRVQKVVEHEVNGEWGNQGDEGLAYEVYECPFDKEMYLRLTITTDSYGDNEQISGMQFVKPTEKTITTFERL